MSKISIVIPVYNAEKYIERCLTSILRQWTEEYQVVLVDDGSTDRSLELMGKLVGGRKDFVLLHQENQGVSAARNHGMEKAEGEWLYFLDADDEMEQDALSVMSRFSKKTCDWVILNYRKHLEGQREYIDHPIWTEEQICHGKEDLPKLLTESLFMYPCGKLYRNRIIREHRLRFPEKVVYGEDIRFNLSYYAYVENYLVSSSSVFIYHIRQGEGAGSAYYGHAFEMQMAIDREILEAADQRYHLSQSARQELNTYFFAQGINTAAAYLTVWRQLPVKVRRAEISKIMRDLRFKTFLENENASGKLHRLDYWLLKKGYYTAYYAVHYIYTIIKKLLARGKR